eukprot:gb/GEZN01018324.1/.p1 GENE.gb/GEZN01018324.1/~~gb/GEZN01018324.1/.p1  ORF type:complete len:109 (+),score=3.75 gb/GEZN01018324.1/:299-625(+)
MKIPRDRRTYSLPLVSDCQSNQNTLVPTRKAFRRIASIGPYTTLFAHVSIDLHSTLSAHVAQWHERHSVHSSPLSEPIDGSTHADHCASDCPPDATPDTSNCLHHAGW